jgi:hypothetical protein
MPKRVLVPSLKVKRLIFFDGSPSKMTKGKKAGTKAATALAHMDLELGREEAAANDMAAPAANKSITGTLATFDVSILATKNSDSDLTAASGQERRHLDGEGVAAAGTGLVAGVFSNPQGKCPSPLRGGQYPQGGHGLEGQVHHYEEFPQHWRKIYGQEKQGGVGCLSSVGQQRQEGH